MPNFPELKQYPYICIDIETTGLNPNTDTLFGIAIAVPYENRTYYYDVRETPSVIEYLKSELPYCKKIVNHNIKFDHHFLDRLGIKLPKDIYCTEIGACLLNEHEPSYALDSLAKKYLNLKKDSDIYKELADIFGGLPTRNVQTKNFHKAPFELMARYAKQDALVALKLYEYQVQQIDILCLTNILKLEMDLYPVIFDMERRGIKIDIELAEKTKEKLDDKVAQYQKDLNTICGFEVNCNSTSHLNKIFEPEFDFETGFYYMRCGTKLSETPKGAPSFGSDALSRSKLKEAMLVSQIKKMCNAKDTFLKSQLIGNITESGTIHPTINQTKGEFRGAGTGRLSYTKPNLQNIPARDPEIPKLIRPLFLPDEGQLWGSWDYSQFEFRMFAHYINDPKINKLYQDDPQTDFHQAVADMAGIPRQKAKTVNLGLTFGMGEGRLAEELGLPFSVEKIKFNDGSIKKVNVAGDEAKELMQKYHDSLPGVRVLLKKIPSVAKSRGHTKSIAGRRQRYPNGKGIYKSPAHLYQGSSADCMKLKLIEIYRHLAGTESRLLLSVHDEFNLSLEKGNDKLKKEITEILECFEGTGCPIKLNVPIVSDYGEGATWAIASGKGT
jgi:DNA polymerase I-like protein with 3'-5' exonuclease and polymerase domains